MLLTATAQPPHTMSQENKKASPGFFSVLLGTASVNTEATTQADQGPSDQNRAPQPRQNASTTPRDQAQARRSSAAEQGAAIRSSMTRDRRDARRDAPPPRLSGTAAFEAAVRSHAESSPDRNRATGRGSANPQPQVSSMRLPRDHAFVDSMEAHKQRPGELDDGARQSRKVSFRTPTSSLKKGRAGDPGLGAAGSSQDSFFAPPPPRPAPKAKKPKQHRTVSKAEAEERNGNSSTATLQNKESPRSHTVKSRRPTGDRYPLATEARRDSFQAVRASGPERVIIVPPPQQALLDEPRPELKPYSTAPAPVVRRPGPVPLAAHPPTARRTSLEASRSQIRSADEQRSRSHRERRIAPAAVEGPAVRDPNRSRSRVEKAATRTPMSPRPLPNPTAFKDYSQPRNRKGAGDDVPKTVRQGSNALNYENGTRPAARERRSDGRVRPQRG